MNALAPTDAGCFVSHMECSGTGERHDAGTLHNLSRAGHSLLVRYDLDRLKKTLKKSDLAQRAPDMWRYRELLPMRRAADIVSLGEAITPLISLDGLAKKLGGGRVLVKDEGRMPTGSFKARGLAVAVSMLKAFGVAHIAMPTAGNAGGALSAYAARAKIKATVFTPADTPDVTLREIGLYGADVLTVDGLIDACGRTVAQGTPHVGWYDLSTLKEPYRVEGKKTMGLEIVEQLGWQVPDVIFFPTGGGTGLIAMAKAFDELEALGWIGSKRPRLVAVQSTGCGPIVKAFDAGADHVAEAWAPVTTDVPGVRVPKPFADRLILKSIRATNGFGVAVDDAEVAATRLDIAKSEGVHLSPEGAATLVAYRIARKDGRVGANDTAVLFNCASGQKYPMPPAGRRLDVSKPIDWKAF